MRQGMTVREKSFILVGFTVVFCALVISYLIMPMWDTYTLTRAELASETASLSQIKAPGQTGTQGSGLDRLKKDIDDYRKQLPVTPDTAGLLFSLNQAAQKTGVTVQGFESAKAQFESQASDLNVTTLTCKVSVAGTYPQIRNFLEQTQNLPRITFVRAVSASQTKTGISEAVIEFETFVANYGSKDYVSGTEIPKANTGKPNLFIK